MMAGALVSIAPIILVFFFAQRQFIEGIALTGVKY
jgi:multiple sugar transport system permease protein